MNTVGLPVIIVCCYLIGEIYKWIFAKRKELFRFIPLVTSVAGGLIGIVIFYTDPSMLLDSENVWDALLEGVISGAGATGANQIVKQIFSQHGGSADEK